MNTTRRMAGRCSCSVRCAAPIRDHGCRDVLSTDKYLVNRHREGNCRTKVSPCRSDYSRPERIEWVTFVITKTAKPSRPCLHRDAVLLRISEEIKIYEKLLNLMVFPPPLRPWRWKRSRFLFFPLKGAQKIQHYSRCGFW